MGCRELLRTVLELEWGRDELVMGGGEMVVCGGEVKKVGW
jgi:hypothetical protein